MRPFITLLLLLSFWAAPAFADTVNINKADAAALEENLTGIGPVKAQAIVDYRKKNGNFKSTADLKNVPGIGDATFSKIKSSSSTSKGVIRASKGSKASKTKTPSTKKGSTKTASKSAKSGDSKKSSSSKSSSNKTKKASAKDSKTKKKPASSKESKGSSKKTKDSKKKKTTKKDKKSSKSKKDKKSKSDKKSKK